MAEYLHDEDKYECIDYLSTDKILYMSISHDYNDQGWGSKAAKVKKQIIVEKDGKLVLNERKDIAKYGDNIRRQFE